MACVDLGLNFIGEEKSKEYAKIAKENLKRALAHPPLEFESAQENTSLQRLNFEGRNVYDFRLIGMGVFLSACAPSIVYKDVYIPTPCNIERPTRPSKDLGVLEYVRALREFAGARARG
ncbi:site-specific DNA-methyltransferase [Helicobacter sp. L8]|uniref:site-specific DNA-methyltransferase n=1 Tax=Helicobacter sp. L8 TaxID=2316078 RepID=UPI001F091824|nr:site-specific DNA-methyltransferase [Helicobacter sp. L8]